MKAGEAKFFEIDNRKFKIECISDALYVLEVFEDGEFLGIYRFRGDKAYAEAMEEILSYSEIDEDDYKEGE